MANNTLGTLIGGIIAIDVVHHVLHRNRRKKKSRRHHYIFDDLRWD